MNPISTSASLRSFLEQMEAYVPGEQPQGTGWIKLNTNEFPYPAAPQVIEAIHAEASDLVRVYPDPVCKRLRAMLAERHGVSPEQILVGNGSDEILRLLAHSWLEKGRRLAVVSPTYTLYEVLAVMFEAQVDRYPLVDAERLPQSLFEQPWDACFLPVPNPPIGTVFPPEQLERLAEHGGLLVLDGAYVDFADMQDPVGMIDRYPNVVISRTFSKSFGMAGMRVGYAISNPQMIEALDKLRDSYNVNRISQAAACGALEGAGYYRERCAQIVASREALTADLSALGFRVHASQGNFVFARHAAAPQIYQQLKDEKMILVRYFKHSGLHDGLRITIGTPQENQALVAALKTLPCLG